MYLLNFRFQNKDHLGFVAASSGSGKGDFEKLSKILNSVPEVRFVCLDVANGYSEHFVEFVRTVREAFPQHVIMVCASLANLEIMKLLMKFSPHTGR